jgi:hypothetical protein
VATDGKAVPNASHYAQAVQAAVEARAERLVAVGSKRFGWKEIISRIEMTEAKQGDKL